MARAGWCADYNEPTSFLNTMLSDSSNNTSHYKSPASIKSSPKHYKRMMTRSVPICMRTVSYTHLVSKRDTGDSCCTVHTFTCYRVLRNFVVGRWQVLFQQFQRLQSLAVGELRDVYKRQALDV